MEVSIVVTVGYVLFGLLKNIFPARRINHFYGYRTPLSRRNKKSWMYAQKLSSRLIFSFALIILLIQLYWSYKPNHLEVILWFILPSILITFGITELFLKMKFGKTHRAYR